MIHSSKIGRFFSKTALHVTVTVVSLILLSQAGTLLAQTPAPMPSQPPIDRAPLGWDTPTVPLPGQEVQEATCPRMSYLVGFREVLGYWLLELRLYCVKINREGSWIDFVTLAPMSSSLTMIGGLGGHNANDFLVVNQTCPDDSYVRGLHGSIVRVKDENAQDFGVFRMPGMINPVCGQRGNPTDLFPSPKVRDWRRPTEDIPWASFEDPEFIGWQGLSSPSTCQNDEVAVGVWSVRDSWIRSVGLICEGFERMRPRTAVELGAAEITPRPVRPELFEVPPRRTARGAQELVTGTLSPPGETRRTVAPASPLTQIAPPSPPEPAPEPQLSKQAGPGDKLGIGNSANGTYGRAICPAHSAMTGTWVVVDEESLKELIVWCNEVDSRGAWMGAPFKPTRSVLMIEKGFSLDDNSIFDNLRKMQCGSGYYVTGFNLGAARVDGRLVPWNVLTECRGPTDVTIQEAGYSIPSGATNSDHYLTGFDGVGGPRSCSAGEVGVGVWGATSRDYVESIGLICQPWEEVRRRSPTESGAAQVIKTSNPAARDSAAVALCKRSPAACAGRTKR